MGFTQVILFLKATNSPSSTSLLFPVSPQRDVCSVLSGVKSEGPEPKKKKKKSVINTAFAFVYLTLVGWSVVSMAIISGNNAGQPSRNWGWKL